MLSFESGPLDNYAVDEMNTCIAQGKFLGALQQRPMFRPHTFTPTSCGGSQKGSFVFTSSTPPCAETKKSAKSNKRKRKSASDDNSATASSSKSKDGCEKSEKNNKRPKRPLTPYNLFFRYQRVRMLMGDEVSPVDTKEQQLCKGEIRSLLENNPFQIDNRTRSHRKTHGKIGFQEMVSRISEMWKRSDAATRAVFKELADEDKSRHAREMEVYKTEMKEKIEAVAAEVATVEKDAPAKVTPTKKVSDSLKMLKSLNGLGGVLPGATDNISTVGTSSLLQDALSLADAPLPVPSSSGGHGSNRLLSMPFFAFPQQSAIQHDSADFGPLMKEDFVDDCSSLPVAADLASVLM